MNVWVICELFLLSSSWILASTLGDMSGALTGIILAKLISSSLNNRNNQPAPKAPILIPPRICIQRVPVPYPIQVPVRIPVPVKVKERVEVKVPVPFKVKEPFPIQVPFPVPYAVQPETKPEPTRPPRPPPVIQLPPNIIHNFIPQPLNKFFSINRRPIIKHYYPKPKPEPEPEPMPEPEPEPEPERQPHPVPEPEHDKEIDEEGDMALLAKIEALRGPQFTGFPAGPGGHGMGYAGMRPAPLPMDPYCMVRGIAPGSVFVPGLGYPTHPGAQPGMGMGIGMGMGGMSHPFQGMGQQPAVFNHMMPAAFPPAAGGPQNMGMPVFTPGIPVTSLQMDYAAGPPPVSSFQGWGRPSPEGRGRNCHKICHD